MTIKQFDLSGKTALVTGSSRGIGKAIAMMLGKAGASVIFHGTRLSGALEQALEEARSEGIACRFVLGDIGKSEDVSAMVKEAGSPDIVVLNASVQMYLPVMEFQEEEFQRSYDTNLRSAFQFIKAFLPGMRERRWGRFVSIGSVNQWKQSPRLPIYASTKSALVNLMMNCARQFAKDGVTFNNIAPGIIETDRNRVTLADPEMVPLLKAQVPAGYFGQPEDCAGVALLLASNAGAYITGADIPVAGGMQL